MAEINLFKPDNRGKNTLPAGFRKEPLFEYQIEREQIILYLIVAKVSEAAAPRRPGRSGIGLPRVLDNKGDAASQTFPKGLWPGGAYAPEGKKKSIFSLSQHFTLET
jgi:hypothetical protein